MSRSRSRCKRRQTPPNVTFEVHMDLAASFNRNENKYQLQLIEICKKYDFPFDDDSVVNIEDLTYEKPNGPRAQKIKTQESSVILNWTFIGERSYNSDILDTTPLLPIPNKLLDGVCSEDSFIRGNIDNELALHKGEHSTSKMCSTLLHSPARGECSRNDNRGRLSQRYAESSRKKMLGMKTRQRTHSRSDSSKSLLYPASSDEETDIVANPQAYDCTFLQKRDFNKSSFIDYKGIERPILLQDCVPLYTATPTLDKPFTWNNKSNRIQSPEKTFTGNVNNRTVCLNQPCMTIGGNKSIRQGKTYLSNQNRTISLDSKVNKSISLDKTFIYNMEKLTISPGKICSNRKQKKMYEIMFSNYKEYIEQNTKVESSRTRRLSINSTLPIVDSLGKSYSKSNCSMNNETRTFSKTDQCQMDSDEVYSSSCKEHMKQYPRRTCTLTRKNSFSDTSNPGKIISKANCSMNNRSMCIMKTPNNYNNTTICPAKTFTSTIAMQITTCSDNRRHSFSTLPVVHSPGVGHFKPNEHFESLYRKLVLDGPSEPKTYLSETVSSLVNSPDFMRVKRPASDDLSFSLLKRKKSVAETFISPSNPKDNLRGKSTLLPKDTSFGSPLPHTAVNSVLPSRMSFHCPVSPKPLPQRVNYEFTQMCNSPQLSRRTDSSVYKKLCYN